DAPRGGAAAAGGGALREPAREDRALVSLEGSLRDGEARDARGRRHQRPAGARRLVSSAPARSAAALTGGWYSGTHERRRSRTLWGETSSAPRSHCTTSC